MKISYKIIAIICVIVVVIAAGVYYYYTTLPTTEMVKIGVTVSLSGTWANYGELHKKAWTAAEWAVNELGGIYVPEFNKKVPLKIIMYDDASDSTQAIKMYEKLITEDKVDFLFGPFGSPLNLAITSTTEKYKKPIIVINAVNYKIFTRGCKYVWGVQLVSFGYGYTPFWALKDYIDKGLITEKPLKIALIYDTSEWEPMVEGAKDALQKYSEYFNLVVEVPYELGAASFEPVISELQRHEFDALIGFSTYSDICGIVKYMKMANFRPKFVLLFDANLPEFIPQFGSDVEGICSYWDWPIPKPNATPLYSKFREYFLTHNWGEPNVVYQGALCAALEVAIQTIEKVGLNSEKIRDYINETEFTTCVGKMKFGTVTMCGQTMEGMNIYARGCVFQIQNGEYKCVWPIEYADSTLRYPLPPTFS
jgi:branched-chain amino acid transport system substrate-binding protein